MLAALWHMLQYEQDNRDLGSDYFDKRNFEGQKRACVNKLKRLGFQVQVQPAE